MCFAPSSVDDREEEFHLVGGADVELLGELEGGCYRVVSLAYTVPELFKGDA